MSARPTNLAGWLEFIGGTHPQSIAMGLERVRDVAARLDVLPPAPRNIVIAGTNGKGSTCVFAEALLRALGRRTGVTLSPHLSRFNERIRIDGRAVGDRMICAAMNAVEDVRRGVPLTYFEYAILAALTVFKSEAVDVCVLEVGLGGRLDAVNLVDADVAVITSIGLDHMEYLGADRASIGAEKAGVLRNGKPLVCGDADMPQSVFKAARSLDVPVHVVGRDFALEPHGTGTVFRNQAGVVGPVCHPALAPVNAAAAIQAVGLLIEATPDAAVIDAAAGLARLAGRFERIHCDGREVVLDVAHNPHGAAFLARQLDAAPWPTATRALAGFLQDKDVAGIVGALEDQIQDWTFVGTGSERGQSGADSLKTSASGSPRRASECAVGEALASMLAAPGDDRVVVLGSFDVVAKARGYLMERLGAAVDE